MSTDIRVRLGNRVRSLRRQKGWTQVELAEMLGIDRSYLSEIETGKKDPSLTILKTIADGFRLSLHNLLRDLLIHLEILSLRISTGKDVRT